jgi:hypothetical protein
VGVMGNDGSASGTVTRSTNYRPGASTIPNGPAMLTPGQNPNE